MSAKLRNKILVILTICLLFSSGVHASLPIINSLKGWLGKTWKNTLESPALEKRLGEILPFRSEAQSTAIRKTKKFKFVKLIGEDHFELVRSIAYSGFFLMMTLNVASDAQENMVEYIVVNPEPLDAGIRNVLHFFVLILVPAYILAIVFLGVYLLFLSSSPKGRARAKSMLARLVVGMILVSASPEILSIFFDVSTGVTESILSHGREEVDIAVDQYTGALWGSFFFAMGMLWGINSMEMLKHHVVVPKLDKVLDKVKHSVRFKRLHLPLKTVFHRTKVVGDTGRTIPALMTTATLVIGVYGLLAFRYFMVMFFTLLFPFTVFFLCFDPTKKLGGTLLEQTLLWTMVQEFYAITLIAVGMGLTLLRINNPGMLSYGFVMFGDWWSFFGIAACLVMMIGPLVLFMLLRKLLPPL